MIRVGAKPELSVSTKGRVRLRNCDEPHHEVVYVVFNGVSACDFW